MSALQGTRAVVVDLHNPIAQRVSLALASSSAAVLEVGGVPALQRDYAAGGAQVTRLATVEAQPGRCASSCAWRRRATAATSSSARGRERPAAPRPRAAPRRRRDRDRVAARRGQPRAGRRGGRRPRRAPAPRASRSRPRRCSRSATRARPSTSSTRTATAASGARRGARRSPAAGSARPPPAPPAPRPLAAPRPALRRAIRRVGDLPEAKVVERTRAAVERVLAAWPASWEARLYQAELAERRGGRGEGTMDALRELGVPGRAPRAGRPERARRRRRRPHGPRRARGGRPPRRRHRRRRGRVREARRGGAGLDAARRGRRPHPRPRRRRRGEGRLRAAGSIARAHACLGALLERERPRRASSPRSSGCAGSAARRTRCARSSSASASPAAICAARSPCTTRCRRASAAMLEALGLAAGRGDARAARGRLARDRIDGARRRRRDRPHRPRARPHAGPGAAARGRGAQARAGGPGRRRSSPAPRPRCSATSSGSRSRPDGLVHYVTYDLRRVSGTTDVAQGAVAYGPLIEGRGTPRLLRRRIHKRDGRILAPDAASNAAQDTATSRSSSRATTSSRSPRATRCRATAASSSSTRRICSPSARASARRRSRSAARRRSRSRSGRTRCSASRGGARRGRLHGQRLAHARTSRRGASRTACPSWSGASASAWGRRPGSNVAAALDENIRSLEEQRPVHDALGARGRRAPTGRRRARCVERVVAAVGKAVKVAGGGRALATWRRVFGGGPQRTTARAMLELGQGSRSWVVYRALRELGVRAELAIAETEPFSSSADFPPHAGRFRHPLVDRAPRRAATLWIDADVEGPPLPPGRISPELRGRAAHAAGRRARHGGGHERRDRRRGRPAPHARREGRRQGHVHGAAARPRGAGARRGVRDGGRHRAARDAPRRRARLAPVGRRRGRRRSRRREGSWEVALRAADRRSTATARPEGKDGKTWVLPGLEPVHIVFPRAHVGTLGATYASRGARKSALSIETRRSSTTCAAASSCPAGAAVARAPEGVRRRARGPRGVAQGHAHGAVIEEDFALSLPTGTVSTDEYKAFVERVQAVDDGFMAGIRVARPAPPARRRAGAGRAARRGRRAGEEA